MAVYGETQIITDGHVWQFALLEFDNFIYHYRIQTKRLMVTSKLLTTVKQLFHPYVAGEIGAGFNHASAYNEQTFWHLERRKRSTAAEGRKAFHALIQTNEKRRGGFSIISFYKTVCW